MNVAMKSLLASVFFTCLILPNVSSGLDWKAEITSGIGSTENLINDTTDIYDAYSISTLRLDLYPLRGLEIAIRGEQTYYRELIGISSVLGGLRLTYMPLNPDSRFALYFSGDLSGRLYHDGFSGFDNNIGEASASLGYRLRDEATIRCGAAFKSTRYVNSATSYKRDFDFFLGGNFLLPLENALDIEAGFSKTNFQHKDNLVMNGDSIPPGWEFPIPRENWLVEWVGESESDLWMSYWSPRVSRSIGWKTGFSLAYTVQNFQNYDKEIVWGFTTAYLSPWASVWEGEYAVANIKSFIIPRLVVSVGTGYWDKRYLKTLERLHFLYRQARNDDARRDWQTRSYISVQFPLVIGRRYFIEPAINIDYTDNKSNKDVYDYHDLSFSAGVTFRL